MKLTNYRDYMLDGLFTLWKKIAIITFRFVRNQFYWQAGHFSNLPSTSRIAGSIIIQCAVVFCVDEEKRRLNFTSFVFQSINND